MLPLLRADKGAVIARTDPVGGISVVVFNCLYPPSDNPATQCALLGASIR